MKKIMLSLLTLFCFCCLLPEIVRAQDSRMPKLVAGQSAPGSITGVLTDSITGKAVEFATVSLLVKGASQSMNGTLTKENGKFEFTKVPAGTYQLVISFIGYHPRTVSNISISETSPVVSVGTLKLSSATTSLKEVTVEALRPTITMEADRMVVNIEGSALAAGKTAYEVLATSPGVYIDQDGNIQLNGRAGVTVMLDGKLTYLSARDLRTMLEGMPAENLKNIEIITNPSAKYDAEGASGILNINLKKNQQEGINGNVYSGYNFNGKQHGYSLGSGINYKSARWNSFFNLDISRRVGGRDAVFTREFASQSETTYFNQDAIGNYKLKVLPAIKLGTDYSLTKNHSIGFLANLTRSNSTSDFLTDTYIGTMPRQPDTHIDADNINTNQHTNFTTNLHYLGKIDTLGTTLTTDLDYVNIRNRGDAYFYNYFDFLKSDKPDSVDFLFTETPNGVNIYSGKTDFTKPMAKGGKLELGVKASRVETDNDSRFYFNNGEVPVPDARRTNHFKYTENIYAGYVNLKSKISENITVQAGVRAEQTNSRGELVNTGQVTKRSYLKLFPSLFVQQKITDNYQINYNYSRRIQRPNYGQLNPFYIYRDPYTYMLGNPYLQPQFTHSVDVTQVFKNTYNLVLNYQYHQDPIAELPAIDTATSSTIYYTGNTENYKTIGATAIIPLKFTRIWDTNNTLILSYNEYTNIIENKPEVLSQVFYMVQSNHNILLPQNLKLEIFANYQGPSVYALYEIEPRWWVNLGLKKSFLEDKLDVSLNVNDVFKSQRLKIAANVGAGNVSYFDQYFRNQTVGLTLRYKFSKGEKFDAKRRSTNLEELNRAGG